MIISIAAEKAFDKIQHPFMIKTLQKVGIEGTYLNIIKAIYDNHTANIILNGEKPKAFPLRSGTRMSMLTIIIQHRFGSPSHSNQRRKRNKRNPNWKLFAVDMIPYIDSLKDTTKKLLELINEFSKAAGYKINTQKSVVLSYTNNKISETS